MNEGAPPSAVMWSIGDIAGRDKVSKPAVSKKVKELALLGLAVERDGQGRVARVNVEQYDFLRGRTDDPSKAQAPGRKAVAPTLVPDSESYDEALRVKTWQEAERTRLVVAELRGDLARVDQVRDAARLAGEEIAGILDRLPNVADDLGAAMTKDGVHGIRVALKQIAARMRGEVAQALKTASASEEAALASEAA